MKKYVVLRTDGQAPEELVGQRCVVMCSDSLERCKVCANTVLEPFETGELMVIDEASNEVIHIFSRTTKKEE